ncbi:hypothetical protein CJF30_00006939 [Rutstroemia sp. NJR-2017a BBW]|nr:hypothetical protein CJF30_00006939 [Rutstroemia sp. NJR-2017a BBW]
MPTPASKPAQLTVQSILGFITISLLVSCKGSKPYLTSANEDPTSTLERVETPPNPSIVIPFNRDRDFKCAVSGSRTALVGLGGVGKSQLAIEYAYRTRDQSPETWVFWVHTSNASRFEQSFREIANYVKIPRRQDLQVNIFQLVHDWLRNERKGKWVLILDNVDDAGFLIQAESVIEPMGEVDALGLLEKKLGACNESNDAIELVTALEFMPLAIAQAAAYICQRAPRYSVQDYLRDFQKSDRKRISLLNFEGERLRRDWEAKNSIIITWQISFDHIRKIRPSAADLLSLMSFFDRQGIPEALLQSREGQENSQEDEEETNDDNADLTNLTDNDEDSSTQSTIDDRFEKDILALRDYSFISIAADRATFAMHRLVQLATRKWLEAHKQQERWKKQFIKNLDAELPTGEYENWAKCQTLFPHAQSALAQQPEDQDTLIDWASILYKAAWYAGKVGKGAEAEEMSLGAMNIRKKILGEEHIDTIASKTIAGLVYRFRGQWDAAEQLAVEVMVQVMEIHKKKLGADHPDALISINNLALTWKKTGRTIQAIRLMEECIESRKRVLRFDHPYTLSSCSALAEWKAELEDASVVDLEYCS